MERDEKRPVGVDLFCGAGGMSLGFEQAGFDVVAAFDANKIAVDSYALNFPTTKAIQADLTKLSGSDLRKKAGLGDKDTIDVLFGGPPCQGFSLIGRRDVDDPRNLLLYEFARFVRELRPRYFVMENVAGLLAGHAKAFLESFIRRVTRTGYAVRKVEVLRASDYGVPQRRDRVFVLGALKALDLPEYPQGKSPASKAWGETSPTVWSAIGDLPDVDDIGYLLKKDVLTRKLGKANPYAAVLRSEVTDPEDLSVPRRTNGSGLTGCMRTVHSSRTVKRFAATLPGSSEPISRYRRLEKDGLATALRAGTGPENGSHTAARPIHPAYPRCITVREAARLHSFPDWFCFHATKWHSFRQIGNSVPPLLARAIGRAVRDATGQFLTSGTATEGESDARTI